MLYYLHTQSPQAHTRTGIHVMQHRFNLLLAAIAIPLATLTLHAHATDCAPPQITASSSTGKDVSRLVDGNTADSGAWRGEGIQTLTLKLRQPRHVATLKIHPGIRAYAPYPSTEGSPATLTVSRQLNNLPVGKPIHVSIPRDSGSGSDFFTETHFPLMEACDTIILDITSLHDQGFRVNSPKKSIVPREKRSAYIREIELITKEQKIRIETQRRKLLRQAQDVIRHVTTASTRNDPIAKPLHNAFAKRIQALKQCRNIAANANANDNDAYKLLAKQTDWLSKQLLPYLNTVTTPSKNGGARILVQVPASGIQHGEIADFPILFPVLEQALSTKLSRLQVHVHALQGTTETELPSNLVHLTPERSKLSWALAPNTEYYVVKIASATNTNTQRPDKLVGNGDHLMTPNYSTATLPGNAWSVRHADVFGDKAPTIVLGRWTDYAHIYRNLGTPQKPSFLEAMHYIARDPFDNPIGTDKHHGLAFSLVEPTDLNGDGKLDLVMSRFWNTPPLFVKNISETKYGLDFDEAKPIPTLPKTRQRYAFGDLNGDGYDDAIAARFKGSKVILNVYLNKAAKHTDIPQFQPGMPLQLHIPDSQETSRPNTSCVVAPSLDDLNNDGLQDLSVMVSPFLYVAFNQGTKEQFRFAQPKQVMMTNGQPFRTTFYYPNFGWGDINGDNIPDLYRRHANNAYLAVGSVLTVKKKPNYNRWLKRQNPLAYHGLANFQIADIDNDGKLEFCQHGSNMKLTVAEYNDGLFTYEKIPYCLDEPTRQRFGCPDSNEYRAAYSQMKLFDFDNDGKLDVLLNDEHNWRFGYFSFYRNLGNGRFAPEVQLAPKPLANFPETAPSPTGQALVVTQKSLLDYLALETKNLVEPQAGTIAFSYAPDTQQPAAPGRTFFSSTFWDYKKTTANTLYENYRKAKTAQEFYKYNPGFALTQLPDNRILLQVDDAVVITPNPVPIPKGTYASFNVQWDKTGTRVLLNGKIILQHPQPPKQFAERIHLASQAWLAMQYAREYPSRRKTHPTDFSMPATGNFDHFLFTTPDGKTSLNLNFTTQFATLKNKSTLLYRCAPGIMPWKDGYALVAHFDDPNRTQDKQGPFARLYAIPFTRTPGKPPTFRAPQPLSFTDGKPFYAHSRTVVIVYDWNKDNNPDIILSTENYKNNHNIGIELFINDGNGRFTRTKHPEITKLNQLITAHHDVKLVMANLFNSNQDDFFVWTDPGLRAYRRTFLRQKHVPISVKTISTER